jgi:glycosyltransferase involved in cell wall biosynthesis
MSGSDPPPRFSVVVPCFNEDGAVATTVAELRRHLAGHGPFEIVVIDDGSTDGTRAILDRLVAEDPSLRVERHERNEGYGAALKTGLRRARAEWIVITDADGTYPNDRIPDLLALTPAADMVVGARTAPGAKVPIVRRVPKAFLRRFASWIAGRAIPDINSGLRVFRRSVAEKYLKILPDGFSFTTTITLAMLRGRYDVRFIPIGYEHRVGKSKIRPIRDTLRFVQLIARTGMVFAPLRVLGPVILLLLLGFLASFVYDVMVLDNLTDKTVLLFLFAMNTGMLALLADMIDKRSP